MGSRKKIVNGASFVNTYNQGGNPKELMINRLVQDNTDGRKIGSLRFDDRLLGIVGYTRSLTKFLEVKGSITELFDATVAMTHSVGTAPYTIVSSQVEETNALNTIRADYMIIKPPTVTISTYVTNNDTNGNPVSYTYTLSDGYTGTVGITSRTIHSVTYINGGITYKYFTFSNTSYGSPTSNKLKFFIEAIKEDGKKLPSRKSYRTMNKMGTTANSFADAYNNTELKDLYYTYSAKSTDDDAIKFTNSIVGDNITIQIDGNSTLEITKQGNTIAGSTKWVTLYNGTKVVDEDGEDVIVLPLNMLDSLGVADKYVFVKKHLGYLSFSTKEVKVKWYQTGLFKFIIGAVLAIYGYFSGNFVPLQVYLASTAIAYVFKGNIIGDILNVFLTIYTFGITLEISVLGAVNALNIASSFFSLYVKYKSGQIADETNSVERRANDIQQQIGMYNRQFLYSPLDAIPYLYTLTYNAYDELYKPLESIQQRERNYFGY